MNYPLSNCCGRPPLGEIHNGFAHCSDCKEMAEFSDHDEEPEIKMNIIQKSQAHIKRLTALASALNIKPESCSTDYSLEEIQQVVALGEWAEKAAQELASLTTLVDWQSNSKRLCEQIEGSDAIGYEWSYWHKKQDEGRAAGERIVMLFDEFKKLSAQ